MTEEEDILVRAMVPVVYWLVFFSIIFHGLSIPALDAFYRWKGVAPIVEDEPAEIRLLSDNDAMPTNAYANPKRNSVIVHNRFSRPISGGAPELYRWHSNSSHETLTAQAQKAGYMQRYEVSGKNEEKI
jgi:hypothetical protein